MAGFAVIGVVLTTAELMQALGVPGDQLVLWAGLVAGLVLGTHRARRTIAGLQAFSAPFHGDGRLTIRVGDFVDNVLLEPGANCVFGANDEFSVRGLQPDSAHAGFLSAFFGRDDEELRQTSLDEARDRSGVMATPGAGPGQLPRHAYGTVVSQPFRVDGETSTRLAFLVANSTRGSHGFYAEPQEHADDPVASVLAHHRRTGTYSETLVFSLIGTGHSRIHNPMQSIFHIIDASMNESRPRAASRRPIGNVVISLPEKLVVERGFDLEAVHLYLQARARIEIHRAS